VLGEGRLTDARGKTASFTSSIVIMTSNLGARSDRPLMGFVAPSGAQVDDAERQRRERYLRAVRDHFRPELLNRIDRIVPFRALTVDEAARIARLFVRGIERRAGLVDRKHALTVEDDALLSLIDGVMQAGGGARALRRTLEDTLVIGVARLLSEKPSRHTPIRVALGPLARTSGMESVEHAGLVFSMPTRSLRKPIPRGPLDTITLLRRRLARWARLGSLEAMRAEVARLVADVVRARRRGDGRASEGLERRLGVLKTRIDDVDRLLADLEQCEERALAAIARDEDASDIAPAAKRCAWELEQAIWLAERCWSSEDDSVERTVMVVGRSTRALGLFLLPFLERERRIGLTSSVHFPAGIGPSTPRTPPLSWPTTRAWGPYLEASEALAFLTNSPRLTSPTWGNRPASVFVTSEGASAYGLLLALDGLVRFRHEGALHDLLLDQPTDTPAGDHTKLPELVDVPPKPSVLIDLDAGLIHVAGVDEPLELDAPDEELPFAERSLGRWVDALPRVALARRAADEGL
jgi:ATP-dependent Clp protease ATP-binding subunit ClpC